MNYHGPVVSPFDGLEDGLTNETYCSATKELNKMLLRKNLGRFHVQRIQLVGSFAEGTRVKDYYCGIETKEFDFLLICTANPGYPVCSPEQDSDRFLTDLKNILKQSTFTFCYTADGKPEILFNYSLNFKVVIDIHVALEKGEHEGYPTYSVLLHSPGAKWRKSYVMQEINLIRSSGSHNLCYRMVKLLLKSLPENLSVMKYHAKMVMMHHMLPSQCGRFPDYNCVLEVLDTLLSRYNSGFLQNVHDGMNVLETGRMHIDDGKKWLRNQIYQLRSNYPHISTNMSGMVPPQMNTGMVPPQMNTGMVPAQMNTGMVPAQMNTWMVPAVMNTWMVPAQMNTVMIPQLITTVAAPPFMPTVAAPPLMTPLMVI